MKKIDLLTGPVGKTILRFFIPTIIGMAATQLYSVVDTMIIGQLMDKYALDAAVGLLVLGGGMWGMERFLRLINTPVEILDAAALYGRVYLLGLPFLMLYDLSRQLVISCGESRVPLLAVLASSAINIVLDRLWSDRWAWREPPQLPWRLRYWGACLCWPICGARCSLAASGFVS